MMLSLDTAYRSFGGEVEASSTPTICRLSDSRRHQLSAIALRPEGQAPAAAQQAASSRALFTPAGERILRTGLAQLGEGDRGHGRRDRHRALQACGMVHCTVKSTGIPAPSLRHGAVKLG